MVTHRHVEVRASFIYLNALEDVVKGAGNDPLLGGWLRHPLHGEGLPTARLAVGEDGPVVALCHPLTTWGQHGETELTIGQGLSP